MTEERHEPGMYLEAFKASLRNEYQKRMEKLRAKYEEELSDAASKKRQEVELQVARRRSDQEKRYKKVLKEAQEHILTGMRHKVSVFTNESVALALEKMEERITRLREDPKTYLPLMQSLATEAIEILGEPAVVFVDTGEGDLPLEHPLLESVQEKSVDRWGGCVVMDAATGTRLVDNTLKTRWERAEKSLRFRLSESFHDVFEILERTAQQLRVS
ncbi:MAG: V-type ATP synthase subunit E family protein [Thermovirgaceae bacterium]